MKIPSEITPSLILFILRFEIIFQHVFFSGFWSFWESVNSCQAMLLQIGLLVSFVTREFFKEFVKMLSLFCVVLMSPKQITPYLRQLFTILQQELQLILYFIMLKKSTQVSINDSFQFILKLNCFSNHENTNLR